MPSGTGQPSRLYRRIADDLINELLAGRYRVGARMPAERELAEQLGVSRPVVREAMLALEVLGYVEVRIGSGAYVVALPQDAQAEASPSDVTPIDLMHARLMIDGEAAALCARNITDEQLAYLEKVLETLAREDISFDAWQDALTAFHKTMAIATRNPAMERMVSDLWDLREKSPECRRMLESARERNFRTSVEQHYEILEAFKARNPQRAREAMRMHLEGSINHFLVALEQQALADARARVAEIRARLLNRADDGPTT